MTVFLVVMSFMQASYRDNWSTANAIQMPSVEACDAVGKAMYEMEPRTKWRCVQTPTPRS